MPSAAVPATLAWWLALFIVPGMLANGWYYRHCMGKIRDVRSRGGSKEQMLARLESAGGTSNIIVIIVAIFGLVAGIGILAAIALPAYQTYTVKAKVGEAVLVGADVAAAVGKQFEQTGALPAGGEVDRMLSEAAHHSRFVQGVSLDGTTGVLTVKVEASPRIAGSIVMVPSADSNHHLTWTCSSEDLKRYVPRSCRAPDAAAP
jgi:Tfp pilus assembly protein PilE